LFFLSVSIYSFGFFLQSIAKTPEQSIIAIRILLFGTILIPVFLIHATYIIIGKKMSSILRFSIYLIAAGLLIINIFTNLLAYDPIPKFGLRYIFQAGPLYPLLIIFFGVFVLLSIPQLYKKYKKSKGVEKSRLKYIFLCMIIGFPGGALGFLLGYNIDLFPLNPITTFFILLSNSLITYAILQYRLMDIRVVLARSTVFGIVYSLILVVVFFSGFLFQDALYNMFGKYMWMVPAGVAVVLASLGPTVFNKLKNKTEWTLFKKQKQYQETLIELGKQMTLTKSINELLSWMTRTVTINVGVSYTRIYLWDEEKKEYVFKKGYGKERRSQHSIRLDLENPVIRHLQGNREPMLREEILQITEERDKREVKNFLRNTGTEIIVPAFIKEKMVGFMSLSSKDNDKTYTPEDINMFKILSGQAALAIENAQFYEKLKESEAELVQASKMSSVGQLASGLAHNLQNPFGSIMMNNEMIESTIEELDKLTEEEKEDLLEYVESSISSSRQGAEIVKSITKFSKPAKGEKKRVSVAEIVNEAKRLTESKFSKGAVLEISIPEELPDVRGNKTELIQVVMNLLTNAADAVVGAEEKKVTVEAGVENSNICIAVKDTGCGIKDKDKEKIFDYFFTTKRNEGTGLGLAFSYQIVKAHGGDIEVESSVGEGSEFRVLLPLGKNS